MAGMAIGAAAAGAGLLPRQQSGPSSPETQREWATLVILGLRGERRLGAKQHRREVGRRCALGSVLSVRWRRLLRGGDSCLDLLQVRVQTCLYEAGQTSFRGRILLARLLYRALDQARRTAGMSSEGRCTWPSALPSASSARRSPSAGR